MKNFNPKFVLPIIATSLIVSGIVYAASITTVMNQPINAGDAIGKGWYQTVNDRLVNLAQGWTCSVSEYYLKQLWCPSGSALYRLNTACGEGSCSGAGSPNACRYMDGSHVGQTDSTTCYAVTLVSSSEYCSSTTKVRTDTYSDWSVQDTLTPYDPSCAYEGGG